MFQKIFKAVFGSSTRRELRRYWVEVEQINKLWPRFKEMTDDSLRGMTEVFRRRLQQGETIEDIKFEAFTVVREACRRLLGQQWEVRGKMTEWDMIPYDVQMLGGLVLHDGRIAEMATGEGKTLVAVAPLYLNALAGRGAHLVTVNDYLAQRDAEWMGGVFRYLGMTVGVIVTDMTPAERRESYNCDVTYGTNNEFGFDYLRDNMAIRREHLVQRDYAYAIIDEVDSVLIDEARTPLIISGQVNRSNAQYEQMRPTIQRLVKAQIEYVNKIMGEAREQRNQLKDIDPKSEQYRQLAYEVGLNLLKARKGLPKHKQLTKALQDVENVKLMERVEREVMLNKAMRDVEADLYYVVDEKGHNIDLTDKGRDFIAPENPEQFVLGDIVEEYAAIESRNDLTPEQKEEEKQNARRNLESKQEQLHSMSQLLRAYSIYERDVDYLIEDDKIIIIDEHTGRKMPGRRWSDGLHQAVEAKEGVKVEAETQTLATITLQNFFRMYSKLAGMTGTAETEAQEFSYTYKMDVFVIPTNKPITRVDEPDFVFRTKKEKFSAIIEEIEALHRDKLPVLVGTKSVEVSELLSKMLKRSKISHNVLNAKYHERESEIVAEAGQPGAVTIATNMAGRGTDIKLGPGVVRTEDGKRTGGLQIIGTERHDSRRIDRQLRGRAGRQGDPGHSRFYVSLEDDLMRLFGSDRISSMMSRLGMEEGDVIQSRWITKAIESAQKKVEGRNFEIRKRTLEYDDVMNKQRSSIYDQRRQVLMCQDVEEMRDILIDMVMTGLERVFIDFADPDGKPTDWNLKPYFEYLLRYCPYSNFREIQVRKDLPVDEAYDELMREIEDRLVEAFESKRKLFGDDIARELSRRVILLTIDADWRDHLAAIDELRENVWTASYAQKEPLVEYQRIASEMFEDLMDNVNKEIFQHFFLTQVVLAQGQNQTGPRVFFQKQSPEEAQAEMARQQAQQAEAGTGGDGGAAAGPPKRRRPATVRRDHPKVGRNDPCPCGSGKKYKNCHGRKELAGTSPQ